MEFKPVSIRLVLAVTFAANVVSPSPTRPAAQTPRLRLAIVGMSGDPGLRAALDLERALTSDARVAMVDGSLVKAAAAGIGYNGSINLAIAEARQLGAAIGCDFFITGIARTATRSVSAGESHAEAIIGVMLVDGRSGALVAFDFIAETGPDQDTPSDAAIKTLTRRAAGYVDRAVAYNASRTAVPSVSRTAGTAEVIEELPEPDSPRAQGFVPPEFTNRSTPVYSEQADRAGVSATVEALVVFSANSEIGDISITRWAGFGLDESAISAIRLLKFNPATRDGKPVSVRAVVQYNFRRSSGGAVPALPKPIPEEKKGPDLRDLFKPKYVRPEGEWIR